MSVILEVKLGKIYNFLCPDFLCLIEALYKVNTTVLRLHGFDL